MELNILPDEVNFKIDQAYRDEDYAKVIQLLDMRKKLWPEYYDK